MAIAIHCLTHPARQVISLQNKKMTCAAMELCSYYVLIIAGRFNVQATIKVGDTGIPALKNYPLDHQKFLFYVCLTFVSYMEPSLFECLS